VRTADGTPWAGRIWLAVNGVVKQNADLSELIWPVPDIISILSRSMELDPGDGNAGQRRRDRCRRQGHRRH
jgi:2-keto-4-pentenoate hydratase/2-oxohepta-3-ene-1,7-dioic acid hydratase in catechol pathway